VQPTANPCEYIFTVETLLPLDSGSVSWSFTGGNFSGSDTNVVVTFPEDGEYNYALILASDLCQSYAIYDTLLVSGCAGQLIYGCTDPAALNYNPLANVSDGSCVYPNGCEFELIAIPDSTNITNLIIYSTLNLETANYVFWDFGDGNSSEETYPVHTYAGEGPYLLCVGVLIENANEVCEGEACIWIDESMVEGSGFVSNGFTISVLNQGDVTSVTNYDTQDAAIWPNPVGQQLYYKTAAQLSLVRIIDLTGREIFRADFAKTEGVIDVQNNAPGLYLLEMVSPLGRQTVRFIKL
jgi:hypothetical protein